MNATLKEDIVRVQQREKPNEQCPIMKLLAPPLNNRPIKLVKFRGSGLLVHKYFYFFSANTHCALVVALSDNNKTKDSDRRRR